MPAPNRRKTVVNSLRPGRIMRVALRQQRHPSDFGHYETVRNLRCAKSINRIADNIPALHAVPDGLSLATATSQSATCSSCRHRRASSDIGTEKCLIEQGARTFELASEPQATVRAALINKWEVAFTAEREIT